MEICAVVGPDLRLFAAYEHALLKSPYFAKRLRDQFYETSSKKLKLPDMYINNHESAFKSYRRADIPTGCLRPSPAYSNTCTLTTTIPACVSASVTIPGSLRMPRTHTTLVVAVACHLSYTILGWTGTTCSQTPLYIALPKNSAWRN